jgi:osmotically-inducible protein OsmY
MMKPTTRPDARIQREVIEELRWDSRVDETDIGVEVDLGVVALTGSVPSYAASVAAVEAAHRVAGVLDVVNDIEVRPPGTSVDTDLAIAIRNVLDFDAVIPAENIRTTVAHGVVTLEGEVDVWAQRQEAEHAIQRLDGILRIANHITIKQDEVSPAAIQQEIENALARRAATEAHQIKVVVHDGAVILRGRVHSWMEKSAILDAVSHAPGVQTVQEEIGIDYA